MSQSRIQKIVIAGNGLTAWLAAATISNALRGQQVEITVIGTVAVSGGRVEPSLPISQAFNQRLGIDERQLMRETSASFSLGTQFNDWVAPGNHYFLPMAPHGASIEYVHFHNYAIKAHQAGDQTPFNAYSLCAVAASQGKFAHPVMERDSIFSTIAYGHHFDTLAYTQFMRGYSQSLGVASLEDEIVGVQKDSENGFIRSVTLTSGETRSADLFIDCSGPEAVLAGGMSEADFEDWSSILPANRVISASSSNDVPTPYSEITALELGWYQRLPSRNLQEHRLVYCDRHLDDENARQLLQASAGSALGSEAKVSKFRQGQRKTPWVGNCIALGAAAGSIESLAVTQLALIQSSLLRLVSLFPDTDCNPLLAEEYNQLTTLETRNIRDFILLHYQYSQRKESPFWMSGRNKEIPSSLAHKIRLFMAQGQVALYEEESFPDTTWVSAWLGQGQWPVDYDPMLDNYDFERLKARFEQMKQIIQQGVQSMPTHGDYLQQV